MKLKNIGTYPVYILEREGGETLPGRFVKFMPDQWGIVFSMTHNTRNEIISGNLGTIEMLEAFDRMKKTLEKKSERAKTDGR